MRLRVEQRDLETLLTPEGRASLPLAQQVLLYLDPFTFFKDASLGNVWMREAALRYNRRQRSILLAYIRRWLVIAASSFVGIASSEWLAAQVPLFIIPAAGFGIGCSVSIAVAGWISATYFLLGSRVPRD